MFEILLSMTRFILSKANLFSHRFSHRIYKVHLPKPNSFLIQFSWRYSTKYSLSSLFCHRFSWRNNSIDIEGSFLLSSLLCHGFSRLNILYKKLMFIPYYMIILYLIIPLRVIPSKPLKLLHLFLILELLK